MRRIVWGCVLLALAWAAWWWAAATGLQGSLQAWFDARRAQGWLAEVRTIDRAGFPMQIRATLEAPALADPATGVAVDAPALSIATPIYWPGHVTVTLPSEPVMLATPQGRAQLEAEAAEARLRLRPGTALELQEMALAAGPWSIAGTLGTLLAADDLRLSMQQEEETQTRYRFDVFANNLTPGDGPRSQLRIPPDWPVSFDSLVLRAAVTFDRPWDRTAIENNRPQPRQISLDLIEAQWGPMRLRLAGDMTVDSEGVPTGKVTLQAENWRDMLTLAENAGLLPPSLRPQAERTLQTLAGMTGNPQTIDVQFNLGQGMVAVGFIPIGPAPRIRLR